MKPQMQVYQAAALVSLASTLCSSAVAGDPIDDWAAQVAVEKIRVETAQRRAIILEAGKKNALLLYVAEVLTKPETYKLPALSNAQHTTLHRNSLVASNILRSFQASARHEAVDKELEDKIRERLPDYDAGANRLMLQQLGNEAELILQGIAAVNQAIDQGGGVASKTKDGAALVKQKKKALEVLEPLMKAASPELFTDPSFLGLAYTSGVYDMMLKRWILLMSNFTIDPDLL
jgi:hypothetical protein